MEFVQAPEEPPRLVGVLVADQHLSCSFIGADPAYVPRYGSELDEDDEQVVVALREEDGHQGFRTLAGFPRWARTDLGLPLGERRLVNDEGRLLPAVRDEAILVPPSPWALLSYEYRWSSGDEPRWVGSYNSPAGSLSITQGGLDLLRVDRDRDYFRPLLLAEPEIKGQRCLLYTFAGEEGTNHVLTWPTEAAAVLIQRLGPAGPEELLTLASALIHPA